MIKCPYCGESYFMEKYSTSTAVYYPPIWKDGVNVNPDRNSVTTYCRCMACGKDFETQESLLDTNMLAEVKCDAR